MRHLTATNLNLPLSDIWVKEVRAECRHVYVVLESWDSELLSALWKRFDAQKKERYTIQSEDGTVSFRAHLSGIFRVGGRVRLNFHIHNPKIKRAA